MHLLRLTLISSALLFGSTPSFSRPYGNWVSTDGTPWRSGVTGECIRSGFYEPANAHPACVPATAAKTAPPPAAVVQAAQEEAPSVIDLSDTTRAAPGTVGSMHAPSVAVSQDYRQAKATETAAVKGVKSTIHFEFDKAALSDEAKAKLEEQLQVLKSTQMNMVVAVGHTDSVGSSGYNLYLSTRRAQAVKDYLEQRGVEVSRIYIEGRGEADPVAHNTTSDARARNRRVEIELIAAERS
jgi:OOP family OmpA-OmpF porin